MKKAPNIHEEKYINKMIEIESVVSVFDADYNGPYYFPGEFHPFWEMVYVTDGEVNVSGDERVYRLHKGDIVFHKPMEFHRLWSAEDGDIHAFIMAFRAKGPLTSSFENFAFSLTEEQARQMKKLILFVRRYFYDENGKYHTAMFRDWNKRQYEIQTAFNMLEIFLLSAVSASKIEEKSTDNSGVSEIYRNIINKLNENIYGRLTLKALAQQCNFSVSQIKRVFSKYSDIGIHKYFLKLKIAMSIRMLGKNMPINEISRTLSFSNQNYFSSVFKRETGLSPIEYKKRVLNINN